MAAKTPVTTKTTSGYVEPAAGIFGGVNPITTTLLLVGKSYAQRADLKEGIYFFSDIDDGDTWTSNIPGIVAVAWQADQADDDLIGATLTTAATGVITFQGETTNATGWLWVKSRA